MTRDDEPHGLVGRRPPPGAGTAQVLAWAVAHAALAPSEHNSQPWLFRGRARPDGSVTVELCLDPDRRLPVVDPDGREAVLACGAALLNLRLALAAAARGCRVHLCPDPAQPGLLARVEVGGPPSEPGEPSLLRAVALRGTHRGPFEPTDVPADVVEALVAEVAREGGLATVVGPDLHPGLVALTARGERALWADAAYRREAAAWSRRADSGQRDGVPGYAYGLGAVRSWLQPTLARGVRLPPWSLRDVTVAAAEAPVVVVVGSADDRRTSVLQAGLGMQRLLLRARCTRLAASYLNAALRRPELRGALAALVGMPAPQVVLRLGYGELVHPTPRRDVAEVLVLEPA